MNRNKIIFILILGLLQFSIGLRASVNDSSENLLSAQDITVENDETISILPIILDNTAAITGFQLDLYLPDGLTVATEDGKDDYAISILRSENGKHRVSALTQADGALRIVCRSMTNYALRGNTGAVLNIGLNVTESLEDGNYQILLKNIVMTDATSKRYTSPDYICSFTKQAPPIPVTIKGVEMTMVYGNQIPELVYELFSEEEVALQGTPQLTCDATSLSPVGTYPIVVSMGSVTNKAVTLVNGTLTITKAPLTVIAGEYTKKQGDAMPEFTATYDGFKNNETSAVLTKQPAIVCSATVNSIPGDYAVTVSGAEAENYEISYVNGKLTVTDASAVTLTARSYTREYGESNPEFSFDVFGETLGGQPVIECAATATSPVGTYPVVIRQGSVVNANGQYVNGTLTITKAPLTVIAGEYTKKQGDAMPEFTATYDGFKNNETSAVLTKQPAIVCSATVNSIPGNYAVTVSGAEAENYEISYLSGKLIVTSSFYMGDVNHDDAIDVTDAVLIIDDILLKNPVNYDPSLADVNGDGEVDVTDVVMVIDAILGKIELSRGADLIDRFAYTAFQMDLTIPARYVLESVSLTDIAKDSHSLAYTMLLDGRCRVVVCSMNNEALPGAWDEVIRLNLRGNGDAQVYIDRAVFATIDGERHELMMNPTSIAELSTFNSPLGPTGRFLQKELSTRYDLQGRKVEKASKGVLIENGKKVVIK